MTHPHRKTARITTNEEILLIRRMSVQAVNVEQKPGSNWQVTIHTGEKGLGPFAMTVRTREEAEAILTLLEDEPVPTNDDSIGDVKGRPQPDEDEPAPAPATAATATGVVGGPATVALSPREGTVREEGWKVLAYEDWVNAKALIVQALIEWYATDYLKADAYGAAIQARLASLKPPLMIVRSSRINYRD